MRPWGAARKNVVPDSFRHRVRLVALRRLASAWLAVVSLTLMASVVWG